MHIKSHTLISKDWQANDAWSLKQCPVVFLKQKKSQGTETTCRRKSKSQIYGGKLNLYIFSELKKFHGVDKST